jgi:hypothetical protein
MAGFLRDCAGRNQAVFFFGGDHRAIYALRDRIAADWPALRVAGICDADFAGPADRAVLDHIAAADADVIVTDLPKARFRQFCAQCDTARIRGKRVNLPGSFPSFAAGEAGALSGRFLPRRLRRFGAAAKTGLAFCRIVMMQKLRGAFPPAGAVTPRRGSRG